MRCWERRVGRIRVSCRHEGISAGRGGGHGVGGVVRRGVFCGPVAVSHECAINAALRAIGERCVRYDWASAAVEDLSAIAVYIAEESPKCCDDAIEKGSSRSGGSSMDTTARLCTYVRS